MPDPSATQRVLLTGATGTIGRAVLLELQRRGHAVVCLLRPRAGARSFDWPAGQRLDVVVSCMASPELRLTAGPWPLE